MFVFVIGHGNPEVPRDNDLRNPVTQGYLRLKPESPELAGHPNLRIGKPRRGPTYDK